MDKKNTILGIALLIFGTVLMFQNSQQRQREATEQAGQRENAPIAEPSSASPGQAPALPTAPPGASSGRAQLEAAGSKQGERIHSLVNDLAEFHFTNIGGALKEVALRDYKTSLDNPEPYLMNGLHYTNALNLTTVYGDSRDAVFELLFSDESTVAYRARLSDQLEVVRRYSISQSLEDEAPYSIEHSLEFRNLSEQPLTIGELGLNIGTVAPSGRQDLELQTFSHYDGEDVKFIKQSKFLGGGFLFFKSEPRDFMQATGNFTWASLKNQFFITILTPEEPLSGYLARPVDFGLDEKGTPRTGLTADVALPAISIAPGETVLRSFHFYAGPKIHARLAKMDKAQEKAMQFGFFGFISKFLLLIMNGLYSFVGNWGIAIILLTCVVRGVLLPITLASMKSMKKMAKLAEPMKTIKEKYPDDTQKQQMMMMELYKLNKINPVAGCLPMVAQIPIFFALFYMLRSAAELRFAEFLWIADLSKPDTVAHIAGLPLNILPFAWLVSLAYQMWTMPTPTVDNAQVKLMKYMPFIFFPFTYTFSSGLVLYWTVSNVFTIGQQWLAKRGKDDFEVQLPAAVKKAIEGGEKKRRRKKH